MKKKYEAELNGLLRTQLPFTAGGLTVFLNECNWTTQRRRPSPLNQTLWFWNPSCRLPGPRAVFGFVFALLVWALTVGAVTVIGVHHLFPLPALQLQLQITLNSQTSCERSQKSTNSRIDFYILRWHCFSLKVGDEIQGIRSILSLPPLCIGWSRALCLCGYGWPFCVRLWKAEWLLFILTASTFMTGWDKGEIHSQVISWNFSTLEPSKFCTWTVVHLHKSF